VAKYPLAALLSVRYYRENNAKNAVRAAEQALAQAQQAVLHAQKAWEDYQAWQSAEEDRRYAAILHKKLSMKELDDFKAGLAALIAEAVCKEEAIAKAKETVTAREHDCQKAQEAALQAHKAAVKIETHQGIWQAVEAKEAERREDSELEEFKPLSLNSEEE
jgi:type III secretion protein O